jgi:hypothetical protein
MPLTYGPNLVWLQGSSLVRDCHSSEALETQSAWEVGLVFL